MSSNTRPKLTLGGRTSLAQTRQTRPRNAAPTPSGSCKVEDIIQTVTGTLHLDDEQIQNAEAFARRLLS